MRHTTHWLTPALAVSLAATLGAGCLCGLLDHDDEGEEGPAAVEGLVGAAKVLEAVAGRDHRQAEREPEGAAPEPEGAKASGSAEPKDLAHAVDGLAKAVEAMGKAGVGGKDGKPVEVVKFDRLLPLLPKPAGGWVGKEPKGSTGSFGKITVSEVSRVYRKGDSTITVKISDSSFNPMAMRLFHMARMVRNESTEGYQKPVTIGGQPGVEQWTKASEKAKLQVAVADRFLVVVEGRKVEDPKVVEGFFLSVDLPGLAALAR